MTDAESRPAVEASLREKLARPGRQEMLDQWNKAVIRLHEADFDGALTAAKTALESTCKFVLDETGTPYNSAADLPKLYFLASSAINIAATTQTNETLKAIFGAVSTLVRSVGELRNASGDAHGKSMGAVPVLHSHAELAVNVASSVACFLITSFDRHTAAKKSRDGSGRIVLWFDKIIVWRLRDHAQNARQHIPCYGEKRPRPALWLVGDAGIYLMSNGKPAISHMGAPINEQKNNSNTLRLTAYAEGSDPLFHEMDEWWPIHNAISDGDDFCFVIPLKEINAALPSADKQIVILVGQDRMWVYSDRDYQKVQHA